MKAYLQDLGITPEKTTVIIQGFGNVGSEAALALYEWGAEIIGISDFTGGIYNPKGLNLQEALAYTVTHKSLHGYPGGQAVTNEELLELPCTVLIPAALERAITEKMPRSSSVAFWPRAPTARPLTRRIKSSPSAVTSN